MEYEPGNICHIEIAAPNLEESREFYSSVFGWTFTPMQEGYEFFDTGNMKGALDSGANPNHDGTVLVMACDDITAKLKEIKAAGGAVLKRKTEIGGGHGYYAYFVDPCGNRMGLWMPAD